VGEQAMNNVNEIRVILGERQGSNIKIDYEEIVDLGDNNFEFEDIAQGEYELIAWIDVRNNNTLENGDYFVSKNITVEEDKNVDLTLEELYEEE